MSVNLANRREGGFALLEVLVTIVILAFGLLGLSGLHSRALTAEMESYQRAQAMVIAQDMVDRMITARKLAITYNGIHIDQASQNCSGLSGVAQTDCAAWANLLLGAAEKTSGNVGAMIGAQGCVEFDTATLTYMVTVVWQGRTSTAAPPQSNALKVTCGKGAAFPDDSLRRWVTLQFRVADQSTI